jgi:hypothetical protein
MSLSEGREGSPGGNEEPVASVAVQPRISKRRSSRYVCLIVFFTHNLCSKASRSGTRGNNGGITAHININNNSVSLLSKIAPPEWTENGITSEKWPTAHKTQLFEDAEFPNSGAFTPVQISSEKITDWKRPTEYLHHLIQLLQQSQQQQYLPSLSSLSPAFIVNTVSSNPGVEGTGARERLVVKDASEPDLNSITRHSFAVLSGSTAEGNNSTDFLSNTSYYAEWNRAFISGKVIPGGSSNLFTNY